MFGDIFSKSHRTPTVSFFCTHRSLILIKLLWQRSFQLQIMVLLNLWHYKETRSVLMITVYQVVLFENISNKSNSFCHFDTHNLISSHSYFNLNKWKFPLRGWI